MFALDPLLSGDVGYPQVWRVLLKVLVAFAVLLTATQTMIWFERKVIAGMQNRVGPKVVGPFGLLQTLADGIKLFFKEDIIPEQADRFVFKLAPFLSVVPAFVTFCVIPIGGDWTDGKDGSFSLFGSRTFMQLADPPIGILLVLAMSSLAVYGIMLAGWASGSKYPLLGSVRASAQMISYEAALGMSVVAVALVSKTLSTNGIVTAQDGFAKWSLLTTGVVPFVIFVIAATAELNRPPFDLVEAEQELVGGFNTEYSSIRFALFFIAEFMNTVTMSAIIVTLFLGGPRGLFDIPGIPNTIESIGWFLAKLLIFLFMYVWFRATLPRLRYDQLMDLGWKVLIPLSFGWLLVLAALRVGQNEDWNRWLVLAIALGAGAVCLGLMVAAIKAASRRRSLEGTAF
ncbi:MAG: NADH-quinone oxidoreductase subunit NuoH [Acidimicrobiia bacterium]